MASDIRRRLGQVPRNKRRQRMPRPLNTRGLERSYAARITAAINPYEELIRDKLFPLLDVITSELRPRLDANTMDRTFEEIRVRYTTMVPDQDIEAATKQSALQVANAGREVFRQQMRTVFSVDPLAAEPWLLNEVDLFTTENVSLIKTLPEETFSDIEQMVFRDARRGLSPQEIRNRIIEQFNATETQAQLIARDQVGKFNGSLTELRQRQIGITRYTWLTSKDGRVRSRSNTSGYSDHASLDGQVFSWDDPPVTVFKGKRAGEKNHPGKDIQCRCHAIPVLDDLL